MLFMLSICLPSAGYAQTAPTQVMATVTAADIDELNNIIANQIPPRWSQPMVMWVNKLIQKKAEADKQEAAEKAAAEKKKTDEQK